MIKRLLYVFCISSVLHLPLTSGVVGQSMRDLVCDLFTLGCCHDACGLDLVDGENAAIFSFIQDGFVSMPGTLPAPAMSGDVIGYEDENGDLVPTSFGPIFAERAETLGSGRFFVGLQASSMSATSFNGAPTNRLFFNFAHEDSQQLSSVTNPTLADRPIKTRDILQVQTALNTDIVVATTVLSAGLTNFLDIGVAIPVVRTRIQGHSYGQILALDPSAQHRLGGTSSNPVMSASSSVNGTATGIGDISARMKINLTGGVRRDQPPSTVGVAFLADVRLPTGDADELLGIETGMIRALAIVSGRWDGISPHVNAGYLLRQGDGLPDAFLGTIGLDARASDHMTFALDLISQWEYGSPKWSLPGAIRVPLDGSVPPIMLEPSSVPGLSSARDRRVLDMAAGLKFRIGSDMVLVTNALVPIRKVGLRPDMMWTLALQSAFR